MCWLAWLYFSNTDVLEICILLTSIFNFIFLKLNLIFLKNYINKNTCVTKLCFPPTTSWNSVLHFWVVTVLLGVFIQWDIVGTVLYKWKYNGILFTIKTFELSCCTRPSLPVVSTRKWVSSYSDNLEYVSNNKKWGGKQPSCEG